MLAAANLGEDADTTAAVAGQVAGATYGLAGIPAEWLARLAWRDRIEEAHRRAGNSVAAGIAFQHDDEFRELRLGQLRVSLGRVQAAVMKRLYEASRSGDGWCFGKTLLAEVGSASKRMSDVYKSKAVWTSFIESDGRGRYRFRISLR